MSSLSKTISKYSDLSAVVAVVVVVVMLVVPLPPFLLDLFIAANISAGLTLLILTMFVQRSLDLAAFPSLLLITTLFRLAINVSVTRLILLHGDAGHMVKAFGEFVVGGNIVVGLVIATILFVIQFVVITNGAGRVAEVAARFTLDAMPGKQMAIDADLNAGQITDEQARERREEIAREADFYGAMDGASKFVKGDAIAGIIIVVINLIGGIVIGVAQQGLPIAEAGHRFSILTIGDALSAMIPALLISTATGILVTRSASSADLGADITGQFGAYPRAVQIAGVVVACFAVVPSLPKIPFIILGGALLLAGRSMSQTKARAEAEQQDAPAHDADEQAALAARTVGVDPLELAIGMGLVPLASQRTGGQLLRRVKKLREQIGSDLGVIIPPIRIHDDPNIGSHEYIIKVRGAEAARAHIVPEHLLAIDTGAVLEPIKGIPTTEPAFGMAAVWVDENRRGDAQRAGYNVVDAEAVMVTHLTETIKRNVHQLLTRQETRQLLDELKKENAAAVEEVVPDQLSTGDVQRVLQALLSEGVAIKDLSAILEVAGDKSSQTRDPQLLAEYARRALARQITQPYLDDTQTLRVIQIAPSLEQELAGALTETLDGEVMSLDPQREAGLVEDFVSAHKLAAQLGYQPIVLTSPRTRRHVRKMIADAAPQMPVVSWSEIPQGLRVEAIGTVD